MDRAGKAATDRMTETELVIEAEHTAWVTCPNAGIANPARRARHAPGGRQSSPHVITSAQR